MKDSSVAAWLDRPIIVAGVPLYGILIAAVIAMYGLRSDVKDVDSKVQVGNEKTHSLISLEASATRAIIKNKQLVEESKKDKERIKELEALLKESK